MADQIVKVSWPINKSSVSRCLAKERECNLHDYVLNSVLALRCTEHVINKQAISCVSKCAFNHFLRARRKWRTLVAGKTAGQSRERATRSFVASFDTQGPIDNGLSVVNAWQYKGIINGVHVSTPAYVSVQRKQCFLFNPRGLKLCKVWFYCWSSVLDGFSIRTVVHAVMVWLVYWVKGHLNEGFILRESELRNATLLLISAARLNIDVFGYKPLFYFRLA